MEEDSQLQYSPSMWVRRVELHQVIPQHIQVVTKASREALETVPYVLNLRYGKGEHQCMDLFGTDLQKDSPIFVYMHGGYWQLLSKDLSAYPVIPLRQAGIRTAVVGYDTAPNVTLDEIVQEIRECAVFILKMAEEDNCTGVWFGGHSAGAHLSASLLDADWFNHLKPELRQQISGVVLISGIYDITPLINTSENKVLQLTRENALKQSPMFKEKEIEVLRKTKALLAIAENDSPAFHKQTNSYVEVLKKKNIDTELVKVLEEDHFSIVENLQSPSYLLTQKIISLINKHRKEP